MCVQQIAHIVFKKFLFRNTVTKEISFPTYTYMVESWIWSTLWERTAHWPIPTLDWPKYWAAGLLFYQLPHGKDDDGERRERVRGGGEGGGCFVGRQASTWRPREKGRTAEVASINLVVRESAVKTTFSQTKILIISHSNGIFLRKRHSNGRFSIGIFYKKDLWRRWKATHSNHPLAALPNETVKGGGWIAKSRMWKPLRKKASVKRMHAENRTRFNSNAT